ncbi:nicotinate-nucleotide pyrophosphorylase [Phaffia rhodozyma]|uniref:Nicotinate-nucleotide pyrophosphorylase [carboxylating] n=1 Tax=Phaffia rhodozyma TaxID=264483 RepID=A0A0F7SI00_PHARH|nr:nicotinate-nucleotide pyrophosphorylase [Phaffia rhodozyma]
MTTTLTTDIPALGVYAHLLPPSWKSSIREWLDEDTPSFDYGGFVVGEEEQTAQLLGKGKTEAVLAGVPFFEEVFKQVGCTVEWHLQEGQTFTPITLIATVRGPARQLLLGERVGLNTLARCSGIATKSRRLLTLAREQGYKGIIAGTRKTTPGFRLVEKYGMLVGGIDAHRYDLSSMVMLKDNHIWSKGSITQAVQAARSVSGFSLRIEVECQSLAEGREAVQAGADVIMLDNLEGEELFSAARTLKSEWRDRMKAGDFDQMAGNGAGQGAAKGFLIESSGNVEEGNLKGRLSNDIDIISTSSVHQSTQHIDFSLKIRPKNAPQPSV